MLLDVSRLDSDTVDAEAMTATAEPGCRGNDLLAALAERDLFFPAGHCPGVAVGGYLLQGGYGWNGRVHGPACMSVEAVDVVTAAGELVRADESEQRRPALGGAGFRPGLLRGRQPLPPASLRATAEVANGVYLYPLDPLEEVFGWAHEIGPGVPRAMELMLVIHRDPRGEPEIAVTGPALVDTRGRGRRGARHPRELPGAGPGQDRGPGRGRHLRSLRGVHASYPDDHRYSADNMWTHTSVEELMPGLRGSPRRCRRRPRTCCG